MNYKKRLTTGFAAAAALLLAPLASAATFRIEIDYMGPDSDGHDHMPDQMVLDAVIQMFACQGHTLIIDLDDEVPHTDFLTGNPGANLDCRDFWTYTGATNTYRSYRNTYRDQGAGWHYCIFAHQYRIDSDPDNNNSGGCTNTSSSGRANGGDAFIVSLGAFDGQTGTLFEQAATLAHEFGHNLGFGHAGSMDSGVVTPYVQNLPSVMSYTYQLGGVRNTLLELGFAPDYALFKNIDYSFGRMCSLNESSLDEVRGTRMMSVDFNCDNDAADSGVLQDLGFRGSGMGSSAPWCGEADDSRTTLVDYNEWANIDDGATLVANSEVGDVDAFQKLADREAKLTPCISYEEWAEVIIDGGLRGAPTLEIESCIGGQNIYVATAAQAIPIGTCSNWFTAISLAQGAATNGSVFYLSPGTFDAAGTTTLNKPGIWSCNTGTARIQ